MLRAIRVRLREEPASGGEAKLRMRSMRHALTTENAVAVCVPYWALLGGYRGALEDVYKRVFCTWVKRVATVLLKADG